MSIIGTKNVYKLVNFDSKKNTVTTARYQQGLISIAKVGTSDINISSKFKKIRPKYDLFAFSHYLSKDDIIFYVMSDIPTKDVQVTRYDHLISAIFLQHIQEESYNEDSIIPLKDFKSVIPTAAIGPTLNVFSSNTTRFFRIDQPIFQTKSPLYDALLAVITLSYHSDEIDVVDYIKAQKNTIFSDSMKKTLNDSVRDYFLSKPKESTASVEVLE